MRLSSEKRLLVAVLLITMCLELAWLLWPRLNLLADPYRHAERQNALGEWGRQRTPESKVVWDRELELLHAHQQRITLLLLAAFVAEGVVVTVIMRRGTALKIQSISAA
jgi:hypothetical protein